MIPVLFESTETSYTTNGLGRLSDAVSCTVTEKRNGEYTLEMEYPITGIHYESISAEAIIYAVPSDGKAAEPFRIFKVSKPLSGIVTIYANHISYDLKRVVVNPFTANSAQDVFSHLDSVLSGWTFGTDKAVSSAFATTVPMSARSILGGQEGSILDVYGKGEYEFTNRSVFLHLNRGSNTGVSIRYGKNLSDVKAETDTENIYNGVVPYWTKDGVTVTGGTVFGLSSRVNDIVIPLDLSSHFETPPTVAQLESRAASVLASNTPWVPKSNIDVSFVALWQTEEYKDIAALERVNLCDTVTVIYEELGVKATAKVIATKYDVLLDRYISIELGDAKDSLADVISSSSQITEAIREESSSNIDSAISHATELITGGLGGHVVINRNADGEPEELLILEDSDSIATATKLWRWNAAGLGYSSNGYNGNYELAMTADGAIVADFITTGSMQADRIRGGVLQMGGNNNANGIVQMFNASGVKIGEWNNGGLSMLDGALSIHTDKGTLTFRGNSVMDWSSKSDQASILLQAYDSEDYGTTTGLQLMAGDGTTITNIGDYFANFGGYITTEGYVYAKGDISTDGNLSAKGYIEADGAIHGKGRLYVDGTDISANNGYVYGKTSLSTDGSLRVGTTANVTGKTTLSGGLKVSGATTTAQLSVENLCSVKSDKPWDQPSSGWHTELRFADENDTKMAGINVHSTGSAADLIISASKGDARIYSDVGDVELIAENGSINVNQNLHAKSTAKIDGTLILAKTQDASGTANNNPALIVGGAATAAHLELDANEIMAKATGTTTAALYLNNDGGTVYANGKAVVKKSAAGSATGPIYINANGETVACTTYANATVKTAGSCTGNSATATTANRSTYTGQYTWANTAEYSFTHGIIISGTYIYACVNYTDHSDIYSYRGAKSYRINSGSSATIDGATWSYVGGTKTLKFVYTSDTSWSVIRTS